jgi:hypothetical protein
VGIRIVPDAPATEHAAIVAALRELSAQFPLQVAALYDSPWRLAGLHENAGDQLLSLE